MNDSASDVVRIANIAISLRYADESLRRALPATVSRFAVTEAHLDLMLTVDMMPDPLPSAGALLFDSGAVWCAYDDDGGYRIDCWSEVMGSLPYKVARFNREFTEGSILIRRDAVNESMHPLDYPLDEVIVAHLLGRGRGVELHGCGIIDRDGSGRLFVGQSGAGKTTTARVWLRDGNYEIVSDDRVIVRHVEGQWRMFGTPWHGEAELSSPQSARLAGIYLLDQSTTTELVPLAGSQAVASLFACTFPLFYDADALSFTLDCLGRIVSEIPVSTLRFVPDGSVIDCVRSAA
jgi:hypothetical protein